MSPPRRFLSEFIATGLPLATVIGSVVPAPGLKVVPEARAFPAKA